VPYTLTLYIDPFWKRDFEFYSVRIRNIAVLRLVTPPRDLHFPECVNRKSFCNIDHVLFLNSCSFAKMGSLKNSALIFLESVRTFFEKT